MLNKYFASMDTFKQDDVANGGNNDLGFQDDDNMGFEQTMDPDLEIEFEQLQLDYLKLQEEQIQCKQRMILLNHIGKRNNGQKAISNRCFLSDGRIVVRNVVNEGANDQPDSTFNFAAGGSRVLNSCSCDKRQWNEPGTTGSSTGSTCILCSGDRSGTIKATSPTTYDKSPNKYLKSISTVTKSVDYCKEDKQSESTHNSETTENTKSIISKSEFSNVTKQSGVPGKKTEMNEKRNLANDFKYSESDDEADETNRLIVLRNADYMDIVAENLKVVIALSGYPKSKMRLQQMEQFQRSLNSIIEMQLKAGLMKRTPQFLDYYLNRGAIVCICKDVESRNWMVRIIPGLQERMLDNVILLKANVKSLCLAVMKIPKSCWPAKANDAFKLLQYFNPTLKTHLWKICSQKIIDDVEITTFIIDRVSGEIIRGLNFKNVIDYKQMEFELTGYTEIYYECFTSELEDNLSSVASRVKLLKELRSKEVTPRDGREKENHVNEYSTVNNSQISVSDEESSVEINTARCQKVKDEILHDVEFVEIRQNRNDENTSTVTEDTKKVLQAKDNSRKETEVEKANESDVEPNEGNTSLAAISDVAESIIDNSGNLVMRRTGTLNIDTNRGVSYHRRTNYLHVENELKIAIVLEGYPQNKLEGTHVRRLKQSFKEYLHKDIKVQRFSNMIVPIFQDVYLSNGAVIYICDSLETKDYLTEMLPKFVTSTGLKVTFRDMSNLVRYTRVIMHLPKKFAHVESRDILLKLQGKYPKLKLDYWKCYSDVAGRQKRQFGLDPESLDVMKSADFVPTYEGENLSFRIIDSRKSEMHFEDSNVTEDNKNIFSAEAKMLRERITKTMYCVPDITNASLITKRRSNHYSEMVADDFKLYLGPINYPETRIDVAMFFTIKKTIENFVFEAIYNQNNEFIPKIYDFYLFDGVIFIICQDLISRLWIEKNLATINRKLIVNLKATEFRGAVGIVSLTAKTNKTYDDIINILQNQNTRLRTKFWRKISTVKRTFKLDVVLQIDKLSAHVIADEGFNGRIGESIVDFKLGHLKTLLSKKKLEELSKVTTKSEVNVKTGRNGGQANNSQEESFSIKTETLASENVVSNKDIKLDIGESDILIHNDTATRRDDLMKSPNDPIEDIEQGFCKMIMKVPANILVGPCDGLDVVFDLLEDNNPGLNTDLWKVERDDACNKGKFWILVDEKSASVIRGAGFDPTVGRERLKFLFYN